MRNIVGRLLQSMMATVIVLLTVGTVFWGWNSIGPFAMGIVAVGSLLLLAALVTKSPKAQRNLIGIAALVDAGVMIFAAVEQGAASSGVMVAIGVLLLPICGWGRLSVAIAEKDEVISQKDKEIGWLQGQLKDRGG
jgi:hypothetical protein